MLTKLGEGSSLSAPLRFVVVMREVHLRMHFYERATAIECIITRFKLNIIYRITCERIKSFAGKKETIQLRSILLKLQSYAETSLRTIEDLFIYVEYVPYV